MPDNGRGAPENIPLSHRGPPHWRTGCWHRVPWRWERPGHGLADDQATTGYVERCCICLQTKPHYWGE